MRSRAKWKNGDPLIVPAFKSEAEEAAWWDANPDFATEVLARAKTEGKLKRLPPTMSISIRFPPGDIARARRVAERKGIRYQTLVKMLVHEGLNREEQAVRGSARR